MSSESEYNHKDLMKIKFSLPEIIQNAIDLNDENLCKENGPQNEYYHCRLIQAKIYAEYLIREVKGYFYYYCYEFY